MGLVPRRYDFDDATGDDWFCGNSGMAGSTMIPLGWRMFVALKD